MVLARFENLDAFSTLARFLILDAYLIETRFMYLGAFSSLARFPATGAYPLMTRLVCLGVFASLARFQKLGCLVDFDSLLFDGCLGLTDGPTPLFGANDARMA